MKTGMKLSKDDCLKNIQQFVGKGNFLSFEHGYRPQFDMWGLSDTLAYQQGAKQELATLPVADLRKIWYSIMEYLVYCNLVA